MSCLFKNINYLVAMTLARPNLILGISQQFKLVTMTLVLQTVTVISDSKFSFGFYLVNFVQMTIL